MQPAAVEEEEKTALVANATIETKEAESNPPVTTNPAVLNELAVTQAPSWGHHSPPNDDVSAFADTAPPLNQQSE